LIDRQPLDANRSGASRYGQSMSIRFLTRLAAGAIMAGCAGRTPAPATPSAATATSGAATAPAAAKRSMLYRVRGPAGATVFLLGSVHLLSPDAAVLPAVVDSAFARAGTVVFETSIDSLQLRSMELLARGRLPAGTTLRTVLSPATVRTLETQLPAYGLNFDQLSGFKPWVVSLLMSQIVMQRAGFQPQLGVDMQIHTRAKSAGKRLGGLESTDFQLGLFDRISPEDQEYMLTADGGSVDSAAAGLRAMKAAWVAGNAEALDSLVTSRMGKRPSMFALMLVDRNRAWVPQIEQMLRGREDVLVVVGAAHLVGRAGVVQMLRDRGYTVEQM
jgi:uncharacterized protein YbaP (TraB family)